MAVQHPKSRIFRPATTLKFTIQSDASSMGWGAVLYRQRNQGLEEVGTCSFQWSQRQAEHHITHRESLASALGVEHLSHHIPRGSLLHLQSDAISTVYTCIKGTKIPPMNAPVEFQR